MKTLHQQQDLHHNSDVRNKNILVSAKGEKNIEHPKSNLSSLFAPFHHFGIDNHALVPFFKMQKNSSETGEKTETENNELATSVLEAYNKQIAFSLDATQKIHKEFTEQITTFYNLNQQLWNTFFSRTVN